LELSFPFIPVGSLEGRSREQDGLIIRNVLDYFKISKVGYQGSRKKNQEIAEITQTRENPHKDQISMKRYPKDKSV
jgi:hypothetical protein